MKIETIKHDGKSIEIHTDDDPENPRDWDNVGTMVCFHKRYDLGDCKENEYRSEDFDGWSDMEKQIMKDHKGAMILPLFLMDHSGLSIRTDCEQFRACDSAGWDWGQVGFVFCSKEKATEEFGEDKEQLKKCLIQEVKTYDEYLTGQVYGFIISENGEETDSCWGFYGLDYCIESAKESAA